NRPGLDPPRHPPARALGALGVVGGVALGAGPVIAASGALAGAGVLLAAAAGGGAGVLPGCGVVAVAGGRVCAGGAGVPEQGAGGGQRAVLLDQLGDPGAGYAQPDADLSVGEALSGPQAGLPQP